AVVALLHPEVGAALQWLRQHAGEAQLTGTGACVFARVSGPSAASLRARAPARWSPRLVRGLNVSPLRAAAGS
ncbi:MAG TPA: 4-(cytidine 5'-diphospho)-2-C-methyl-D-erythritol kinase, partial [Gammaproteobacteria bacterium]|nr:4-(cytidine 5'-diphospho)-2-C-methyl-D-erythritol kinase [Gammaproteobacteria bacterium]